MSGCSASPASPASTRASRGTRYRGADEDDEVKESEMSEPPAVLRYDENEVELPIVRGTENEPAVDISKLRVPDRLRHARLRLRQHRIVRVGDHVHRRRRRHPPLPRDPHRAARRARPPVVPRDVLPPDLGRAADPGAARRLPVRGASPHAHQGGREALLRRLPEGRAPDGDPVLGRERAVDLLPGQRRHPRRGAGAPVDRAPHRQAPDDRVVRVQEVDRTAVPLSRTTSSTSSRTS